MSEEVTFDILGDLLYPNISSGKPLSDVLVEEYFCLQDLDGNGLIYGYDFFIEGTVPPALADLELNIYWKKPSKYIPSWSDYIENNIDNITEV